MFRFRKGGSDGAGLPQGFLQQFNPEWRPVAGTVAVGNLKALRKKVRVGAEIAVVHRAFHFLYFFQALGKAGYPQHISGFVDAAPAGFVIQFIRAAVFPEHHAFYDALGTLGKRQLGKIQALQQAHLLIR